MNGQTAVATYIRHTVADTCIMYEPSLESMVGVHYLHDSRKRPPFLEVKTFDDVSDLLPLLLGVLSQH